MTRTYLRIGDAEPSSERAPSASGRVAWLVLVGLSATGCSSTPGVLEASERAEAAPPGEATSSGEAPVSEAARLGGPAPPGEPARLGEAAPLGGPAPRGRAARVRGAPPDEMTLACRRLPARHGQVEEAPVDRRAALDRLARGAALVEATDWTGARSAFAEAVRLDPGLGLAHLGLAETLAHLGGAAADRRAHLAAALVDLPQNPRAHVRFASALVEIGDPAGGLRHLRCALDLRAELDDARRRAALLALELEGPEAAAALLSPLFDSGPEARDWVLLGEVRAAQHDLAGAAEALETAALQAGSAPLYRRAAKRWDEAGEVARADAARQRADDLDPPARRKLRPLRPARVRAP